VDSIVGKNSGSGLQSDTSGAGPGDCKGGNACQTAVLDAVATAQLTDDFEAWAQFVFVRHFGNSIIRQGDTHAFATAARYHVTDKTSFSTRVEYLRADQNFNIAQVGAAAVPGMSEVVTATFTGAQKLTDDLTLRAEVRYDHSLTGNIGPFASQSGSPTSSGNIGGRNDQLLGIAELYYEF